MKIHCRTTFDLPQTGITGHFRPSQVPFTDRAGNKITDLASWTKSRNQQRNLETISQLLQLRTQIFEVTDPVDVNGYWSFEFSVEFEGIYQQDQNQFGTLQQDCEGVPMLLGLNEQHAISSNLVTDGSQQNIWFELISVNN